MSAQARAVREGLLIPVVALPAVLARSGGRLTVAQQGPSYAESEVVASPANIADDNTQTSTVTVSVQDRDGQPLAGETVVLSLVSGTGTLTQPGGVTNAQGTATGTFKSNTAGAVVIRASVRGVAVTETAGITVTAGGGGGLALSGTVKQGGVAVANAGIVELLDGTTVADTVAVDGSGAWSFSGLASQSYGIRLQPRYDKCLKSDEPDAQDPTSFATYAAGTSGIEIEVADAQFYEIFDYPDSATLRSQLFTSAAFPPGTWDQAGGFSNTSRINHLPTGGPTGGDAMEYDFPAKPTVSPPCFSYFLAAKGRPNSGNGGPTSSTRWVVIENWFDANWSNGNDDCSNSYEYKVLNFLHTTGGPVVVLLLYGGTPASRNMVFTFTVNDAGGSTSNALQGGQYSVGQGSSSFFGAWHQLAMQLVRFDGSSTNWEVHLWIGGVRRLTLLGSGAATPFACQNQFRMLELGANMNTGGPTVAQKRKISRVGVYATRPSLRADWAA